MEENNTDIVKPTDDSGVSQPLELSTTESHALPPRMWQATAAWLNIPLDHERGNMFEQISQFFRSNTVASGEETIQWRHAPDPAHSELTVPTADLAFPRVAVHGHPTHGWWMNPYSLPDGSEHVRIIAELDNSGGRAAREAAVVNFVRKPGSQEFELLKAVHNPAGDNAYIEVNSLKLMPSELIKALLRQQQMGSTNATLLHVINRPPAIP